MSGTGSSWCSKAASLLNALSPRTRSFVTEGNGRNGLIVICVEPLVFSTVFSAATKHGHSRHLCFSCVNRSEAAPRCSCQRLSVVRLSELGLLALRDASCEACRVHSARTYCIEIEHIPVICGSLQWLSPLLQQLTLKDLRVMLNRS